MAALHGGAALQRLAAQNRRAFAEKHGEGVYTQGGQVEPFARRGWATESVVIAAGEEAEGLRETLERAEGEEECRAGRVQVVVVENGSCAESMQVVEEYRERLRGCLTVVVGVGAVERARAEQIGRERAIGERVRVVAPGEWEELGEMKTPIGAGGRQSAQERVSSR
jgi:hypothetical protein